MNLFEQQAANRRRTWFIMALFVLFFVLLGLGFDLFLVGADRPVVPVGSLIALVVGTSAAAAGYYHGDRAVLASAGAVPVARAAEAADADGRFRLRQFENVAEEMAIAAGLPRPRLYVIPDPDPNAFATGRDPAHAAVAVTQGLLDALTRDELQAVVAHEMSHIRNYDVRLLTVVAALVGAVVLLSDWARRTLRWGVVGGGRRRRDGRGDAPILAVVFVLWLVAVVLAPLVAQLLALAVSRRREYLADASAAELTRNPGALADALEKIDAHAAPTRAIKRGSAHLCIADPLGRRLGLREGFWADLFATHPPMAKRIALLRQMAYQPVAS